MLRYQYVRMHLPIFYTLQKAGLIEFSKSFYLSGKLPKEKKERKEKTLKFSAKKEAIIKFISSLNCVESHYYRTKTRRQYLPCGLNVKKLSHSITVKLGKKLNQLLTTSDIFLKPNLTQDFVAPRTNICFTCIELGEIIKQEKNPEKKIEG